MHSLFLLRCLVVTVVLPPVLPRPPSPRSPPSQLPTPLHLLHLYLRDLPLLHLLHLSLYSPPSPNPTLQSTFFTPLSYSTSLHIPQAVCWASKQWGAASLSTPSMSTTIWTRTPTCPYGTNSDNRCCIYVHGSWIATGAEQLSSFSLPALASLGSQPSFRTFATPRAS